MSQAQVAIEHGGPIDTFTIDMTEGPGVYELRGTKGAGKSTAIRCCELLSGRKVDLTVTDGHVSGKVQGFGVVAPIGSRKKRRGNLEIDAFDSERFSIEDLIDPPFKDAAVADRHRIKALISLRGVLGEEADYYELVGGKQALKDLVPQDKLDTDDPVLLCQRIKECAEAKARHYESQYDTECGHAEACREMVGEVDLEGQYDAETLQKNYDDAKQRQIQLEQEKKSVEAAAQSQLTAQMALKQAQSQYSGASVEDASKQVKIKRTRTESAKVKVAELEKQLEAARQEQRQCEHDQQQAETQLQAAEQHEATCASWRETLAQELPVAPSDQQIEEATKAVNVAHEKLQAGVRARDAIAAHKRAERHTEAAKNCDKLAKQWRATAQQTLDVLTELVDAPGLTIKSHEGNPRFVVDHPRRGETLFKELSDGERVRYVIDALLDTLQDGPALFPVPQRIWQDLPPADRQAIHDYALKKGLYIVAGLVTDDETLSVRRFESDGK